MTDFMLTTIDNPFSPFTQFSEWLNFDREKGYDTCQLLARVSRSTPNLGMKHEQQQIDDGMDEIIDVFAPLYFKLGREDKIKLPIANAEDLIAEITRTT